jgi:hypothetical protein
MMLPSRLLVCFHSHSFLVVRLRDRNILVEAVMHRRKVSIFFSIRGTAPASASIDAYGHKRKVSI